MPIDPVEHLGNLIKNARLQQKITQEQLSIKTGVSLRHIANIEKAKSNASFEIAYILIRELNIPADMILYSDYSNDDDKILQEIIQVLKSRTQNDLILLKNLIDFLVQNLDQYRKDK